MRVRTLPIHLSDDAAGAVVPAGRGAMAMAGAADLGAFTLSKGPAAVVRQSSSAGQWGAQSRLCLPTVGAFPVALSQANPVGRNGFWQDAAVQRPAVVQCVSVCSRRRGVAMWSSADGGAEGSVAEVPSPEEEEDRGYVQEIMRVLELLRTKRDMTPNEVRLTIMIEDPRDVERRRELGVEDERGCSREDMGNALAEVIQGKIPADRLVLRELTKELLAWPNLEDEFSPAGSSGVSPYARVTNTGVDPKLAAAKRAQVDWDAAAEIGPGEETKTAIVPPAVGFSVLYIVSSIPVVIGVIVVIVLFLNSLQ